MYLQLIIPHSHVHIPDHVTPVCTCSEIDRVPILLLKHQSLHLSITTMRTGSCSATYKCFEIHTVPTSLLTWHASIKNHNVQMFLLRCVCARARILQDSWCVHTPAVLPASRLVRVLRQLIEQLPVTRDSHEIKCSIRFSGVFKLKCLHNSCSYSWT